MAAVASLPGRPQGVPAMQEVPSPPSSSSSRSADEEQQQLTQINHERSSPDQNAHALTRVLRTRPHRSPSRLPLRTAFRNGSSIVEILVGDDSEKSRPLTRYLVHKDLLVSASPFFAAALSGNWTEGKEQVVRLPEEKAEIFEWFLQWLYTGSLTVAGSDAGASGGVMGQSQGNNHFALLHQQQQQLRMHPHDPSTQHHRHELSLAQDAVKKSDGDLRNSAGSPKYFLLLDLYALSDRLLTQSLNNHILTTLARLSESTNSVPTPSDTFILYDIIRDSAPLRTLILDLFAYKKTDKLLETHRDEWHPRFLRELVVKLKRPGAGTEVLERHSLEPWRSEQWVLTRACEGCREVLKPGITADKCVDCGKVFCGGCLRRLGGAGAGMVGVGGGGGVALWGGLDTSGCKPWIGRGLCARYHEHGEGERC